VLLGIGIRGKLKHVSEWREMTLADFAGFVGVALTLLGAGFAAGRTWFYWREKRKPIKSSALSPADAFAALIAVGHSQHARSLDIIGYSVHTIYRSVAPLVEEVLRSNGTVRVLALDPRSRGLDEKTDLEHASAGLDPETFRGRSADHISKVVETLVSLGQTVVYQGGGARSDIRVRVYDVLPVYRAVIADKVSVSSSYLDALDRPSRDFPMRKSDDGSEFSKLEDARARNWFDYVWRYRSRPHDTEAVVFDLYDTIVRVDPGARLRHQTSIAKQLDIDPATFVELWDATGPASNSGQIGPTTDRFEQIRKRAGIRRKLDLASLAEGEHAFLGNNAMLIPGAIDLLGGLRARGYRIGLLSNCSASVEAVLAATGLRHHVDGVVLSYRDGLLKPDVRAFELIQRRLGVEPAKTIFAGDGANDELVAATAAGMRAVRATWANSSTAAPPGVRSASSIRDLARAIDPDAAWQFS
jgi:putative hydrolase of the HAD superfamily